MNKFLSALAIALVATSGARAQDGGDIDAIIGGTQVATDNYPWLGSLQSTAGSHFCGSSLIRPNIVLTAAHCVSSGATNFRVRLGTTDLNSNRGVVATPARVYVHENYNSANIRNDIAVIELTQPVTSITPVNLDLTSSNAQLQSGNVVIAGWGLTVGGGSSTPRQMREATVPIVADTTCDNTSPFSIYLDDASMVCIGTASGSRTACNGDSGGPMFSGNTQIGLTSWGASGCTSYAVYTQIPFFANWINTKIAQIGGSGGGGGGGGSACSCIGSGTDVGATCGNWLEAGFNWCYSDVVCPGSTPSQRYPGLHWFECTPSRFDAVVQYESLINNHPQATIPGSEQFFKSGGGAVVTQAGGDDLSLIIGISIGAGVAAVVAGTVFLVYKKQRDAAVESAIDRVEAERRFTVGASTQNMNIKLEDA